MTAGHSAPRELRPRFARACATLCRLGKVYGASPSKELSRSRRGAPAQRERFREMGNHLTLAGIACSPQTVFAAAKGLACAVGSGAIVAAILSAVFLEGIPMMAALTAAATTPFLCHQAILSYPASAARKRASDLLKSAPDGVNLMVMGVRQDSSLSNAIEFASDGDGEFHRELRRCTWEVVTGVHAGFEDALHALGTRWEDFCAELKTSLNAVVVASHEATEEGRRRALERANRALVSGAKRMIEEYALSLSGPTMLLFGLGILLPIMVGSFMPMLSWDLWSLDFGGEVVDRHGRSFLEMALVMDVVFPAIALAVAMDAASRRPVDRRAASRMGGVRPRAVAASFVVGGLCAATCMLSMGDLASAQLSLLSGMVPASLVLALSHRQQGAQAGASDEEVQDLLFKSGACLLDGDNLETALHRTSIDAGGRGGSLGRRLVHRAFVMGLGFDSAVDAELKGGRANSLEALKVVGRASVKDEAGAGMLAMDLSSYLRDLSEIESTLKMRLKPTISMMRMTAHALGPIVLGITYAIYVSLGSVAGGYGDDGKTWAMIVVLGVFLAEMNAVVCYFVWGIEGTRDARALARSVGWCALVSQMVFVSTTILAV